MKTKYAFLTVLFLSLLYAGCEKDEPGDPTPTPAPALYCDVQVDKDTVYPGGNVMFAWTSNADSLILIIDGNNSQSLSTNGSKVFAVQETSSFVFTFMKSDSAISNTFNISVIPLPPPIPGHLSIGASPETVNYGDSAVITVSIIEPDGVVDSITVTPDLPGFTGAVGTFSTPPITETITYVFVGWYNGASQPGVEVTITRNYFPLPLGTFYIKHPWVVIDSKWQYVGDTTWKPLNSVLLGRIYYFHNDLTFQGFTDGELRESGTWDISSDGKYFLMYSVEEQEILIINDSTYEFIEFLNATILQKITMIEFFP